MARMFDGTVSRKTKRSIPKLIGHYTAPEAAEKLGVDVATLKYRRDAADAKTLWEMIGVSVSDPMNELLAKSHVIHNKHHYYERKQFNKFAAIYLKRPEVIRARKRHLTFPNGPTELGTFTITTAAEAAALAACITSLLAVDGPIRCNIFSN